MVSPQSQRREDQVQVVMGDMMMLYVVVRTYVCVFLCDAGERAEEEKEGCWCWWRRVVKDGGDSCVCFVSMWVQ